MALNRPRRPGRDPGAGRRDHHPADIAVRFRPAPTAGLCLDEGVLSLFSLICCSYGYYAYKQEL
jgi:hypothetical protein